MLTKKDFKELADMTAGIRNKKEREEFIEKIIPFCRSQNGRFQEGRFREWIDRRIKGVSTRGLG